MKTVIKIQDKTVTIFYSENYKNKDIPIIILNTFDEDGQEIWDQSKELTDKEYILVTISNINWNQDMSPWYMDRLFKAEDDYTGKADEYIELLTDKIIPEITTTIKEKLNILPSQYILAGYSLAGLFAIYSLYKTDKFDKIISCSGSFWYPNFIQFVKTNELQKKPEKIYFSLGNRESKTKNEMMSKVEENTKYLKQFYDEYGVETIYEENQGNHFQDVSNRIAKGIYWILM